MLPLTETDQGKLLRLAREAVEQGARRGRLEPMEPPPGALSEARAVFVTLHKGGRLRGCMGFLEATAPLCEAVRECAFSAALRDPRFQPVTPDEVPALHLEISVLSPLEEIAPELIEIGKHGLVISLGARRGLLLPQVAVEWKWDRTKFLEETCLKARLPADAWKTGATVQAFTARVFAEPPHFAAPSHHAA